MTGPCEENLALRDRALRAIGRNIVDFQRLETCLKILARFNFIASPLSTLRAATDKRVSQTSRYTLGQAIGEWLKVAGGNEPPSSLTEDSPEIWVLSFGPMINSEKLTEHGQSLSGLLAERNNLVHHDLAQFEFDSEEECKKLIMRLDSQNGRILEQLSVLKRVLTRIQALQEAISQPETQAELIKELCRPHDETRQCDSLPSQPHDSKIDSS